MRRATRQLHAVSCCASLCARCKCFCGEMSVCPDQIAEGVARRPGPIGGCMVCRCRAADCTEAMTLKKKCAHVVSRRLCSSMFVFLFLSSLKQERTSALSFERTSALSFTAGSGRTGLERSSADFTFSIQKRKTIG